MNEPLIFEANPDTSIVFGGLTWQTLLGANLAAQSMKAAVANKATHFVAAGEHSASCGTVRIPSELAKIRGRSFYSAAAIFAQAHQGGVFLTAQDLGEELVWVAGVHDGNIIQGTDVLLSKEDARALIEEVESRFKDSSSAVNIVKSEFDLETHLNIRTKLAPVKNAFQKIPRPLLMLLGGLVGLIAIDTAWDQYKKAETRKALELEAQQPVDARNEWANALDVWAGSILLDGPQGLTVLIQGLGRAPMDIGGWDLVKAGCTAIPNAWSCSANYDAGIGATNLSFVGGLPTGWTASWNGLTGAVAAWTVPAHRTVMKRVEIQPIEDFSLNYISALQRVLPAFRSVELSPPVQLELPDPQVSVKNGSRYEMVPVTYPAGNTEGIEKPSIQTIELVGPARSLFVLPLINYTKILSVSMAVEGVTSVPTLRDSLFTTKLVGEMYVR
ncbi:type 4b pilus protein PilO2 [Pseudomonas sp. RP23018S]|uniref:type 4b pilus protein PilO2 n=1 Tax=Pseudomonas sp. RP23018S TaxID=3096037 RepID=UPI002ACA4D03|nr:type 4b pilus protein PilO2 [Pseudomonas sp. RP23018S]MDZ5605287.1 type 4b pilus protein PilO2 [Pseudomonas sp. RP23018S]